MKKISLGIAALILSGGTAWSLPPWDEASDASDAIKQLQSQFALSWETRRALASAQGGADAVPVEVVQKRLRDAAERLVRADRENPRTRRSEMEMGANPYATAPGDNGAVDRQEAESTQDPLAIALFDAADDFNGSLYLEGGGPGGFVEKVMPAFTVSLGHIRLFEQFLEQVLDRVDGDGDRSLTGDEAARLPDGIAAYFKEKFRGEARSSAKLSPLAWKKAEKAVRDACRP